MGKSSLLMTPFLLVLLLVSAASAGNPSAGLDEACKKTPDPDFCALLLEPSAAEFTNNDPKQMGFAAINATLDKVKGVKTYMLGKAVKGAKNKELQAAIMDCVEQIDRSEGALKSAIGEYNQTGGDATNNAPRKLGAKAVPIKQIDTASTELMSCRDALQKNEEAGMAGGGENADITSQALRSAKESVLACSIAKSLFMP